MNTEYKYMNKLINELLKELLLTCFFINLTQKNITHNTTIVLTIDKYYYHSIYEFQVLIYD